MCNISQGIREEALLQGRIEGKLEGKLESQTEFIRSMYENKLPLDVIAACAHQTIEDIRSILNLNPPA